MRSGLAWLVLLAVGIILIASSIEGNLGSILGSFLTPGALADVTS